jgi:hypothetical protein
MGQYLPLHLATHHEVLVHEWHRNLAGLRVGVKAFQHGLPWDGVKIAAQQEPTRAQAVLFSIRKDQFVMDILLTVGFAQGSQGRLKVFGGPERKRLPNQIEAPEAELG